MQYRWATGLGPKTVVTDRGTGCVRATVVEEAFRPSTKTLRAFVQLGWSESRNHDGPAGSDGDGGGEQRSPAAARASFVRSRRKGFGTAQR